MKKPETQYQIAMRLLDRIVKEWAASPTAAAYMNTDLVKETTNFMIRYHGEERYEPYYRK